MIKSTIAKDRPVAERISIFFLKEMFTGEHYCKIGLCSKSFVSAAFGPETIGGFCPGSNG